MATKKGKKGTPMASGETRCYSSAAVANRVAGALKAKGKRATATGKCVKRG
jgi:hypothetical protein